MANLKSVFLRLGVPPPLWATNSPTRIYEYQVLTSGVELKDKTVLDFGCGEGLFAMHLAAKCKRVIALDMNGEAIARAKKFTRNSARKKNLDFRIGQIAEINLPDESVDEIFCACVLQLVDDLPATLKELRRVLKPNGKIRATVDSFSYLSDERLKEEYKQTHHIVEYFNQESIMRYFENAGFTGVQVSAILKGKTAKEHFVRYFKNSGITYNLLNRFTIIKKIADEDKISSADTQGAELLIRAGK